MAEGTLEQLTQDDSWAATILAQDPKLGPADIAHHPMRNVLTNALGARESVDIHLLERDLAGGERLLLCSDGLHGSLDATAIARVMSTAADCETAARGLVSTALERGSRDNVTALVVSYEKD
jgi:protein phosphatase